MARPLASVLLALSVLTGLLAVADTGPAAANWLTKILKEAGEESASVSGRAGRAGLAHLDEASHALKKLPEIPGAVSLAAHATPEGHWQFINRNGETYTSASPEELARLVPMLAPELAGNSPPLTLVLSEDSVFRHSARIDELPAGASLRLAHSGQSFPMLAKGKGAERRWFAEVRPSLLLELTSQGSYRETMFQLARPLRMADIRLLTFETGGPKTIASAPKRDASGRLLPDLVAPEHFANAVKSHAGSTVIVSGGLFDSLPFGLSRPTRDGIAPDQLREAAAAANVNLIVLNTSGPWQPGGRNWFGQAIEVEGLASALEQPGFGDFLATLASRNGRYELKVAPAGQGRIRMDVVKEAGDGSITDMAGSIGEWLGQAASHVTGEIATTALTADVNDEAWQSELDQRIIPGIPSNLQFAYLLALVAGVIGWGVARDWWTKVMPRSKSAGWLNWLVTTTLFFVLFLPLVGVPALLVTLALQAWVILTFPYRAVRWLLGWKLPQSS